MITQTAKPEAESQSGHRGARDAVRKWKSIYADQMMDIKRGPEKGPVSMETVDKRVRLDVDAGKAVKELLKLGLYKANFRAQFNYYECC